MIPNMQKYAYLDFAIIGQMCILNEYLSTDHHDPDSTQLTQKDLHN